MVCYAITWPAKNVIAHNCMEIERRPYVISPSVVSHVWRPCLFFTYVMPSWRVGPRLVANTYIEGGGFRCLWESVQVKRAQGSLAAAETPCIYAVIYLLLFRKGCPCSCPYEWRVFSGCQHFPSFGWVARINSS